MQQFGIIFTFGSHIWQGTAQQQPNETPVARRIAAFNTAAVLKCISLILGALVKGRPVAGGGCRLGPLPARPRGSPARLTFAA